jgi:DNA (cytosine-5)-methyltransferase 1
MENVKNLVGRKFKPQFDIICQKLEELGYNNYWSVMNGKDFNVPQNRERVMMISVRKDVDKGYKLPIGTPLNKTIFDVLENHIESKYYLSDVCIEKMKRFMPSGEVTEYVCPTLTTELAHSTGKNLYPKLCKILGEYRRLTPLECWRLMGYSDEDFYKAKNIGGLSDTKLYERSARGIVVPMLEEIFRNLLL